MVVMMEDTATDDYYVADDDHGDSYDADHHRMHHHYLKGLPAKPTVLIELSWPGLSCSFSRRPLTTTPITAASASV